MVVVSQYGSFRAQEGEKEKYSKSWSLVLIGVSALALIGLVMSGSYLSKSSTVELDGKTQLNAGDARETRPLKNPLSTTQIGGITVDNTVDNGFLDAPLVDVEHADCSKDLDPDCQTSVQPLLDKEKSGGKNLARSTSPVQSQKSKTSRVHGLSTKASDKDIASYFKAQATQAEAVAKRQHYKSDQLSSKQAADQLQNYFNRQQALAAKPQAHAKRSTHAHAAKEVAPKFGLSGSAARTAFDKYFAASARLPPPPYVGFSAAAADADLGTYFATQLRALPAEQHAGPDGHGLSDAAARADLASYFSAIAPGSAAATAAAHKVTPDMIFSRVRDHKRASAAQNAAAAAAADSAAARRLSSGDAVKDMEAFFSAARAAPKKRSAAAPQKQAKQSLAAYGAGVEEDNAVEVRRARPLRPSPRFNPSPSLSLALAVSLAVYVSPSLSPPSLSPSFVLSRSLPPSLPPSLMHSPSPPSPSLAGRR